MVWHGPTRRGVVQHSVVWSSMATIAWCGMVKDSTVSSEGLHGSPCCGQLWHEAAPSHMFSPTAPRSLCSLATCCGRGWVKGVLAGQRGPWCWGLGWWPHSVPHLGWSCWGKQRSQGRDMASEGRVFILVTDSPQSGKSPFPTPQALGPEMPGGHSCSAIPRGNTGTARCQWPRLGGGRRVTGPCLGEDTVAGAEEDPAAMASGGVGPLMAMAMAVG